MNGAWNSFRDSMAQRVTAVIGVSVSPEEFVIPPKLQMGDVAFACFGIAKKLGQNPSDVAKNISNAFGDSIRSVESVEANGPYVNVTLRAGEYIHRLVRDVEQAGLSFGASSIGKGQRVLFEYAQPNTHKEMHVGHLRNLVLGSAIVNVLRHAGFDVIAASYHGDVGAHVAKCLWWLVESYRQRTQGGGQLNQSGAFALGLTEGEVSEIIASIPKEHQTGKYLGEVYAESTRELAANESRKELVSQVQQAIESQDAAWHALWKETRHWSLVEFAELFEEVGVHVDRQYLESEVEKTGQEIVEELRAKGVAKESDGAMIVDLQDVNLGVFLVRKSDGTSLYSTKDLALAQLKDREYPDMQRSVMLVDNRQMLYFKQLFETLKRMGYHTSHEHIGYEFVTLKGGAMSSREGNVVTYQQFRDEVFQYAWEETKKRHSEWMEGQVTYTAWAIAVAGMKFGMLKQDAEKVFTFDLQESLAFDGDTGPYCQYAAVRLDAILRKAGYPNLRGNEEPDCRILTEQREKDLAIVISRFEEVAEEAARSMRPSLIAHWCVEAAHAANAFYRDVPVLDADERIQMARLRFVYAARDGLRLGLNLLGIPVPEEM